MSILREINGTEYIPNNCRSICPCLRMGIHAHAQVEQPL